MRPPRSRGSGLLCDDDEGVFDGFRRCSCCVAARSGRRHCRLLLDFFLRDLILYRRPCRHRHPRDGLWRLGDIVDISIGGISNREKSAVLDDMENGKEDDTMA